MCTRRRLRAYARQPSYNLLRPATSLFMALMFASVFAPNTLDDKEVLSDVTAVAIGERASHGANAFFPTTPKNAKPLIPHSFTPKQP